MTLITTGQPGVLLPVPLSVSDGFDAVIARPQPVTYAFSEGVGGTIPFGSGGEAPPGPPASGQLWPRGR